jgi:hypothetical protein
MPTKYTIFGIEISRGSDQEWSQTNSDRLLILNRLDGLDTNGHVDAIKPIEAQDFFELEEFPSICEANEGVQFWIAMLRSFGFKSSPLTLGSQSELANVPLVTTTRTLQA